MTPQEQALTDRRRVLLRMNANKVPGIEKRRGKIAAITEQLVQIAAAQRLYQSSMGTAEHVNNLVAEERARDR